MLYIHRYHNSLILFLFAAFFCIDTIYSQYTRTNSILDERVKNFLETHTDKWIDMNIPASDGQQIYDLILKNNYKKAVEIGTSTGHSAIWMAWALSKTGGKLITIEIDPERYNKAVANFKEAGLLDYIDARLGNAHTIVPELPGTYDFVFCDADKEWYKNYFIAMSPKLEVGGCYVAHNVINNGRSRHSNRGGTTGDFYNYINSVTNYSTILNNMGTGMTISTKTDPDITQNKNI